MNFNKLSLRAYFVIIAIIVFVTTIFAMINHYNPIPFWDEWNAYLGFYKDMQQGSQWELLKKMFSQHNEHKIFFTRVFFYIGFKFFNGALWFQFIMLVFIQLITLTVLSYIVYQQVHISRHIKIVLVSVVFILGFSWIQVENFTWGFQTQFLGISMNALVSFFLIYQYSLTKSKIYYYLTFVFVFLSCFSMANGVFAVFVFILLVYLLNIKKNEKIFLILFSFLNIILYLFNFKEEARHSSISDSIIHHPLEVFQYIIRYVGSPTKYFFEFHNEIVNVVGLILVALIIYSIYLTISKKTKYHYSIILVAFLTFGLLSVFFTATGRIKFGFEQAMSSRYQTPTLLIWISLILFYFVESKSINIKKGIIAMLCIMSFFVIFQQEIKMRYMEQTFNRKKEFLGFRMGIKSPDFLNTLYPAYKDTLEFLELIQHHIQPFNVLEQSEEINSTNFTGYIDQIEKNQLDTHSFKVKGWLYDKTSKKSPQYIKFKNHHTGKVIGFAVTGKIREDVLKVTGNGKFAGFEGFLYDTTGIQSNFIGIN